MRYLVLAILILAAIVAGSVAAINSSKREKFIDDIVVAAEFNDREKIAQYIDWDTLRSSLKKDLKKRLSVENTAGNAWGGRGKIGPAVNDVDDIIDYYVQPKAIGTLFWLKKKYAHEMPFEDFVEKTDFNGLTGFKAVLSNPDSRIDGVSDTDMETGNAVIAYFSMQDGMKWQLIHMDIPLVYIPTDIPDDKKTR